MSFHSGIAKERAELVCALDEKKHVKDRQNTLRIQSSRLVRLVICKKIAAESTY